MTPYTPKMVEFFTTKLGSDFRPRVLKFHSWKGGTGRRIIAIDLRGRRRCRRFGVILRRGER